MKTLLLVLLALAAAKVRINGIEPNAGPLSGNTRVLVRGGPFQGMEATYASPKCKFGRDDLIVEATYVKCSPNAKKISDEEAQTIEKTATCL